MTSVALTVIANRPAPVGTYTGLGCPRPPMRAEMIRQPVTRRVKVRDPQAGKLVWQERTIRTGLTRGVVNQRIGRIKRVFIWAVSEQLIPETTYRALLTVEGLHRGRSDARETEPVLPVTVGFVEATLPQPSSPRSLASNVSSQRSYSSRSSGMKS